MKKARWGLRIITRVGDLAASLAILFPNRIPRELPDLSPDSRSARDTYYSTTKGADCAISCFEIASFTLISHLVFAWLKSGHRQSLFHRQLVAVRAQVL